MHLVPPWSKVPNRNFRLWYDKNDSRKPDGLPTHHCSKFLRRNDRTIVKSFPFGTFNHAATDYHYYQCTYIHLLAPWPEVPNAESSTIMWLNFIKCRQPKDASTLCRAAEYNTRQLCLVAKVARHRPPMRSHPNEKRIFYRPSSGYQNCGTRSANLVWFFSQTGWYYFETPYWSYAARLLLMGLTICRTNF